MKMYERIGTGTVVGRKTVLVNGKPLEHRVKHSPSGMNWGYGGSGAADLALSILWDLYGEEYAQANYQRFKWDIISKLPQDQSWKITEEEIERWKQNREKASR
jgi:hypothetical protein